MILLERFIVNLHQIDITKIEFRNSTLHLMPITNWVTNAVIFFFSLSYTIYNHNILPRRLSYLLLSNIIFPNMFCGGSNNNIEVCVKMEPPTLNHSFCFFRTIDPTVHLAHVTALKTVRLVPVDAQLKQFLPIAVSNKYVVILIV